MKKYRLCLLLMLFSLTAPAADFKLILKIATDAREFTTDQLGNVFIVTDNRLVKIDLTGNRIIYNDEKNLGTIVSVDASNPFKIVAFYKDFSRVQILDNKLVPRVDVNLLEKHILQPLVVAYAQGEGLWVYDQQDFRLKKFDHQFKLITESSSLDQILTNLPNPVSLLEADSWLLMNDPAQGILLFDRFGNYYRTLALKGLDTFQVKEGKIIFFHDTLKTFDLNTLVETEIAIPATDDKIQVRIENNRIYILKEGFLEIYES
jgi:hypothetical protein